MLEPLDLARLTPGPLRSLAARHGVDLEPELPDPAPAYVDPLGALHPSQVEPLSALPLHSWPTPSARAALAARALSEPIQADPTAPDDPVARLIRFAREQDMEPEVQGALHLLGLRALLAAQQRSHRPPPLDPAALLVDPDQDPFARRRARLCDADGWQAFADVAVECAGRLGDEPALAFERAVVAAAGRWLPAYRAWWRAAALLPDERVPEEAADRAAVAGALDETVAALRALAGLETGDAVDVLSRCLDDGGALEAAFVADAGATSDGPVRAASLVGWQIKAMRDLASFTRPRALWMHRTLRDLDVLRLGAHLARRVLLLRLWLADADDRDTGALEDRIVAVRPPTHTTTLSAGLGRLWGVVLLRRLRRGDRSRAEPLAAAALQHAPEELAVRIARNDLRFVAGPPWDADLLPEIEAEVDRWSSLSGRWMGGVVAEAQGHAGRARRLRDGLFERAARRKGLGAWLIAASELLRRPAPARRDLGALLLDHRAPTGGPLEHLVGGGDPTAAADLRAALRERLAELDAAAATRSAEAQRGRAPAWRQILRRHALDPDSPDLPGVLHDRLLDLRAAAPPLRDEALAPLLRALTAALSRAADLSVALPDALAVALAGVPELLGGAIETGSIAHAAEALRPAVRALQATLRIPRRDALDAELRAARGEARARGDRDELARLAALQARLAAAEGRADPDGELDAIDEALPAPDPPDVVEPELPSLMRLHPDFARFSTEELGLRPDALRRARLLVDLFNQTGGRRDRKRLKGQASGLFELRHRTRHLGGLRVFYRRTRDGWEALAAMSKYDERPQRAAIARILTAFPPEGGGRR